MTPTALGDAAVATDRVTATGRGSEVVAATAVQPPASTQPLDPAAGSGQARGAYGPAAPYGADAIRSLTLREYGRELVALSSEQASALNGVGNGRYLSVEPGEQPGYWQVGAHNYVGSINVGGLQVLVRPKIPSRNLFLLLEVGLRPRDWHDEAVRFETTGDLLPALVSFFARTTETTLARGLYHSYREQRDRLVALRGRVDIARQLAQPGVVIPTACRFTEFTADLIENSYLKAAVSRSLRVAGVQPVDRRRLMQHLVTLEDVGDVRHRPADHDRVVFTRLNEHYRPALRLAQLVLANLTLQDTVGKTQASSFMLDMNKLFERFVTERLRRALKGRLEVKDQHSDRLDEERTVTIKPDLLFRAAGSPRFVADIKYKLTDEAAGGRNADYYQLLAYTTALDLPEGVLIYCLDANRGTLTGESEASNSAPGDPATGHSAAGDTLTSDPAASHPGTGDLQTGDPATGDPATGDPATGDPGTRDPATGDPATGDPATGDPGAGDPQTGDGGLAVRSVRVRHAGKVLHTYALDLSGSTADVDRNLDRLADWIEDRAAAVATT